MSDNWKEAPILQEYFPPAEQKAEKALWESAPVVADVSPFMAAGKGFAAGLLNVGLSARELAGKGLTAVGLENAGRYMAEPIPGVRQGLAAEMAPYQEQYPLLTGAGKFTGEVVGTAPVGFALGAPFKGATRAAFQTGGMNFGPMSLGNVAVRGLAGAAGGASTAALTNEDVGAGAGIGAILPFGLQAGARAAQGIYGSIKPIIAPGSVAVNALNQAGGPELLNALRQSRDMQTTPGFSPTLTERAIEGGMVNPTFAALEARAAASSTKANQEAVQVARQRVSALEAQKARVDAQIMSRQASNLPAGDLTKMQAELTRALETEYAQLTQPLRALGAGLPEGQAAAGQNLIDVGRAKAEQFKATEVRPQYRKAFDLAGDARIDVTPIVERAEAILGEKLVDIKPANAPATVRALAEMRPSPPPAATVGSGRVTSRMRLSPSAPAEVPTVTLENLDALRKAINQDLAAASTSADPTAAQRLRFLGQLHPLLDEVVANSKLSPQAKEAYGKALETYRTGYVPKFKTGVAADVMRDTSKNQTKVLPDDVIGKFLSNETNAQQFVTTYGSDANAIQSLQNGVADMFRAKVVDPVTKEVKPDAAAKFLQDNKAVFDTLQRNGVDIQSTLQTVQQRAATLKQGLDELAARSKNMAGAENPSMLVDRLLKSAPDMEFTVKKLSPAGKSALADEVVTRVNRMPPDEALRFLTGNSKIVSKAVGGDEGYSALMDLAKRRVDVFNVEKSMPRNIGPTIAVDTRNATPEQLTSLTLLAQDIKRMQYAAETARAGLGVNSPAARALGTESARETGMSAAQIPTLLDFKVSIAKNIWQKLEQKVNARAAAQLAHFMVTDPDAAIKALEAQAARRALLTPSPGVSAAVKSAVPRAITNLYGNTPNENALAQ